MELLPKGVKLKLKRDEARIVEQEFLPYMIAAAEAHVRSSPVDELYNHKAMLSMIHKIDLTFKRKLLSTSNKLSFHFEDHYAYTLFQALGRLPLGEQIGFKHTLRQRLIGAIDQQLSEPVPAATENTLYV